MKIEVLKAIPAAGKTKAIVENIVNKKEKSIIASISRLLSKQSFDYFCSLGGQGVLIDSDNKLGSKSVNKAIEETQADVLFITHSALLSITDFSKFKGFSLYIDEVPELVSFNKFTFSHNLEEILKYCHPISDGLSDLILDEKYKEEIEELALQGINQLDDICVSLLPLYKALLQGIPTKISKTESGATCYFINDVSSKDWEVFDKVTISAANIEDTFTGKILKYFNKWDFVKSPLEDKLVFKEYSNTSRIQINVMFENSWSKHNADKEIDGLTNYSRIKNILDGLIGDEPFIYTRNSYRARFNKGLEVPYNPHGLNSYTDYRNVVVMFSFNPLPWQIPILKELAISAGLEEDELVNAYIVSKYLEPAFQLCARTNIRVNKSNKKVNLFVPDMRLAKYIKDKYFKNATICTDYMLEVPKVKQTRKRVSFQKQYEMSTKEKYRYMYLLRKIGRKLDPDNIEDQKIVKDWIEHTRK
ncbi:hypothetical protein KNT81_gp199 [Proteus phage phiP4-3]|uniref:Uncharacterized protein n=1 Tax=Proteus phage phiP4-3 TaxID=2065203 RepID=A0A2I6PFS6_9CAUD|nr:hypothetical protein KNT81_gp199 [Proteus phage phiP4-3]AUM58572.1 hypothetical protein phiP43_214 [Proteus phage phiP4-3]